MTDFIAPYQDKQALAKNIGKCEKTIDAWVKMGKLPPPKASGLWKWTEVEQYLDHGEVSATESPSPYTPEAIRESTKRALRAHRR